MSQNLLVFVKQALIGIVSGLSAIILTACSASGSGTEGLNADPRADLTVFAAASLTDAFREIGRAFETTHPSIGVTFNFAGSQQLALQIEQGAQADVFASADQRHLDRLVLAGLVSVDSPMIFAGNRMVVILPNGNPGQVERLADLADPGLKLLLAGEQVPAGVYAREVLEKLSDDPAYGSGFKKAVLDNVISNEENVKQVVAKVQLGEADAGIVYRSDLTPGVIGNLDQVEIPDRFNVNAAYPIAVLGTTSDANAARLFVQFVLAPEGQRILEIWGLIPITQGE